MVPKRGLIYVVLAVLLVLSVLYSSRSQVGGCYVFPGASEDLYCQPDTLDTEAAEDCSSRSGCAMSQHFLPGSDCSTVPECEEVTCSADCKLHALGTCQQLGGVHVPEEQYNFYCSPGCCKIADKFCAFNLNRFQCEDKAKKLGYPHPPSATTQYVNPVGMSVTQCNQQFCQVQVTSGQLHITVQDSAGNPLAGVQVTLEGTSFQQLSDGQGKAEFSTLPPSTYLVVVQREGFQTTSATLSLQPGSAVEYTFTLVPGGTLQLSGQVTDETGLSLSGVTLAWSGPSTGIAYTDVLGNYKITGLFAGTYTLTASKIGFLPQQQTTTLAVGTTGSPTDFTLPPAAVQGIKGKTIVDFNHNGVSDDDPTYGVKIYVDGNFRGYSQFPEGNFELSVAPGEHVLAAIYQQYQLKEQTFTLATDHVDLGTLLLTAYVGECSEGQPQEQKNVEQFSLHHVPGKKQVRLEWLKPCPEVISYIVAKSRDAEVINQFRLSPAATSFIDPEVEWGVTYGYSIIAVYPTRLSASPNTQTITLGDKECADRYQNNHWESFCLIGSLSIRQTVFTCDDNNKLGVSDDCTPRGVTYFCSPLTEGTAHCQDAGLCEFFADPFGLYYSRHLCYGAEDARQATQYCYYDSTDTITNKCGSCATISSCFDYRSKDACTINNCFDTPCHWVDGAFNEPIIDYGLIHLPGLVTSETGQGYCVPEEYDDDDYCSRCQPTANLFENYYCSAPVCTALGKCFANNGLTACKSCGDTPVAEANCYTYTTELECAGASSVSKNPLGEIEFSADRCGWKRCSWQGPHSFFSPGSCVKDGDGNGQDDCSGFIAGELADCRLDISPPRTTVLPEEVPVISLSSPTITFSSDDNFHLQPTQKSPLGTVHYCLTSAHPGAADFCTAARFQASTVAYPGAQKKELAVVNLLASPDLQGKDVNGETYRLQFFSTDKYHNQEEIQETFVFIDKVVPQFEVNYKAVTKGDQTKLTAYLEGTTEPMTCSFTLTGVVPIGTAQSITVSKDQEKKEVLFDNLPGVVYDLTAACLDNQGNKNEKSLRLVFDLEERISIVHPALHQVLASPEIRFRATTAAGAACGLYRTATNEKVADFLSNEEGKVHETLPVPGFIEGNYDGEYKIVCRELLAEEQYEDYFSFQVDFTPPSTQIVLRESSRTEKPTTFGWEEFFVNEVKADFECAKDGFACDKTYYCLGEGCYYLNRSRYQEYGATLTVSNSTLICYYSTDLGNNPVYSPFCGTVRIEGYGIELEHPPLYYYLDEQWGISNEPSFDWRFFTRVPTQECRFDFVSDFNYVDTPIFKTLLPWSESRYLFPGFPNNTGAAPYPEEGGVKAVYVKCRNVEREIGPPRIMNLEYDPSPPQILQAVAKPPLLTEGTTVDLLVETDDKTLCKYSSLGHDQYELMPYAFPGAEADVPGGDVSRPKVLRYLHPQGFLINTFTGLTKLFSLTTQCKNGAGDYSDLRTINFTVDYTQLGAIQSIWPAGEHLASTNVTMRIETSKNALCSYREGNNPQYQLFETSGEKVHLQPLPNLIEKYYQFPVHCALGDHLVKGTSSFTIDLTPPNITQVVDGNYTCGAPQIKVWVYTNEENVSAYYYQLYDWGREETSTLFTSVQNKTAFFTMPSKSTSTFVLNGSVAAHLPIDIPTLNLNESHRYKVRVQARDAAGHLSLPAESDGILIVFQNHSLCQAAGSPAAEVTLNESSSCTSVVAEIRCTDTLGCSSIKFGQSPAANSCSANQSYLGQKLIFHSNGWLCYTLQNYAGKNSSSVRKITFLDADGDGLSDREGCDTCPETAAGEVTDSSGCGGGQVPLFNRTIDLDKDSLPDYWEQMYNAAGCLLDYTLTDSNSNGVADGQEDYDQDGFGNYDEYLQQQDPCKKDVKPQPGNQTVLEERCPPNCPLPPLQKSALPWILLILGLALILGGSGYLVYYYQFSGREGGRERKGPFETFPPVREEQKGLPEVKPWSKKLFSLKKARRERERKAQRKSVFEGFTSQSAEIPHLSPLLEKKTVEPANLQKVAETFVEHKEEIVSGLRAGEKGIFSRLEKVATQSKGKKISDLVSREEAEEIFGKLQKLARKRKEQK